MKSTFLSLNQGGFEVWVVVTNDNMVRRKHILFNQTYLLTINHFRKNGMSIILAL